MMTTKSVGRPGSKFIALTVTPAASMWRASSCVWRRGADVHERRGTVLGALQRQVPKRQHADRTAAFDNRQPAHRAAAHGEQRVCHVVVGRDHRDVDTAYVAELHLCRVTRLG